MSFLKAMFTRVGAWKAGWCPPTHPVPRSQDEQRAQAGAHDAARATLVVRRLEQAGWTAARAAEAFGVGERTVRTWPARWRAEGAAGPEDRSSRPGTVAKSPGRALGEMAARLRRGLRLTGAEIAERLRLARSTVAGHLARLGIGRPSALEERPPVVRFERERPGELLHLDTRRLARFERVGHRIAGDRRAASGGAGWEVVHVAVDDASRLAHVEVPADEKRATTTGFLVRAQRWSRTRGIRVERVMRDNGAGYASRLFRKARRILRLRRIRTRPYTPRTNGKAGRFTQTMLREWAYAVPFRRADSRARDLPRSLAWHNHQRPHAALGGSPPTSRLPAPP